MFGFDVVTSIFAESWLREKGHIFPASLQMIQCLTRPEPHFGLAARLIPSHSTLQHTSEVRNLLEILEIPFDFWVWSCTRKSRLYFWKSKGHTCHAKAGLWNWSVWSAFKRTARKTHRYHNSHTLYLQILLTKQYLHISFVFLSFIWNCMLLCFWHALTSFGQVQALPRQQSFSSTVPSEEVEPPTKEQLHRHTKMPSSKRVCQERARTHWWSCSYEGLSKFSQIFSGFVNSFTHHQKNSIIVMAIQFWCFAGASKQRQCLSLGAVFHRVHVYRSTSTRHVLDPARWNTSAGLVSWTISSWSCLGIWSTVLYVSLDQQEKSASILGHRNHRKLNEREGQINLIHWFMFLYSASIENREVSKAEVALNFSTMAAQRSQGFCSKCLQFHFLSCRFSLRAAIGNTYGARLGWS